MPDRKYPGHVSAEHRDVVEGSRSAPELNLSLFPLGEDDEVTALDAADLIMVGEQTSFVLDHDRELARVDLVTRGPAARTRKV